MREHRILSGVLAVMALLLSSCSTAKPTPAAVVPFADVPPAVGVDAASLDVVFSTPAEPHGYPYVGYLAPVTYQPATSEWAKARFHLTGNSVNKFRVTLRQGTITEKLLPVTTGVSGWFKKEQAAEYSATLSVELAVVDPNGQMLAVADGQSTATQSIGEGATAADKAVLLSQVLRLTFDNLDKEILPRARASLSAYIH